ncbi:MAG: 6,7-dimethyl-8-ribityllumazine synthase [Flavobacteriales bacterium]|nr:6,7-dimethyl-8-ribityllumazine synthase [Flavobacteriales bacterium]MCX7651018.1 6,7-dimethyl-8-ribityllumazine synthase [Flavobacteriales bacterium]MDW8432400.1 6,7-dimethyl-8-ribityllumazine synthase [Flavobacteriales bacterium]
MATALTNLSTLHGAESLSAAGLRLGIVVSEWNAEITSALLKGAVETLLRLEGEEENILIESVPGAFELPFGAQLMARMTDVDAVICLGCVIRGETPHFDYVCQAAAQGILEVGLQLELPVIFGVLTTDTLDQARERAGGRHGNKGVEAALAALKMVGLAQRMSRFEASS